MLETLAEYIAGHLKQREFCVVFEAELERCWPSESADRTQREKQIQAFAKSHGWSAFILEVDSGIRAVFQQPGLGVGHSPRSDLKGNGALFGLE